MASVSEKKRSQGRFFPKAIQELSPKDDRHGREQQSMSFRAPDAVLLTPHKMHAPGSSSSWQRCSSFRHCWEELPNITVLICRVSLELISDGFYPSMLSGHVTSRRCFLQRNRRRKFADDLIRDCVPRGGMTV